MNNIFEQGMFSIDQNATPDMLARKRAAIQNLLRSNGSAKYTGQGLAHLAQGVVSGVQGRNMDKLEGVNTSEATDLFSRVLGRSSGTQGGNTPFLAPTAPATPVEAVATPESLTVPSVSTAPMPDTPEAIAADTMAALGRGGDDTALGGPGGGILGAEVRAPMPSTAGLDLSGAESRGPAPAVNAGDQDLRLLLARTLQAEAGNEGLQGMIDVGSVMRNREASGRFGDGLEGVIMRPGQFSAWNSVTGYANGEQGQDMSFTPREDALRAADAVLSGNYEDQTGGATHYVNYNVSQPSWFNDSFQRRGNHWFGDGDGAGAVNGNTGALANARVSGGGGQRVATGQQGGDQLQQFGSNLNMPELMELAANPWLNVQQRSLVNGLIGNQQDNQQWLQQQQYEQQQQANDPLYQAKLAQAQFDLTQDQSGGGATDYGLTPQYGVDDNGNPVIIQIGRDGTSIQTPLPEGVSLSRDPIRLDAGTEWVLLDPITRQPIGSVPKNNAEAAAATARGRIEGESGAESAIALPSVVASAQQGMDLIDSIMADPALPSITGMVQGRLPPMTQSGVDLNIRIKQLQGQAFVQAFQDLKGGGAITEREGQAATAAIARLERAQSLEAYVESLNELKAILAGGVTRAQQQAGQPQSPPPIAPTLAAPTQGVPQTFQSHPSVAQTAEAQGITVQQLWDRMTDEGKAAWN